MSQADVAARAKLSEDHIGRLEQGRRRPSDISITRLARALRPRHDIDGAAALAIELEELAGTSLFRFPRRRMRVEWGRALNRARKARAAGLMPSDCGLAPLGAERLFSAVYSGGGARSRFPSPR